MNMNLIVDLVTSLAWPAVTLIFVLLFRRHLISLFQRLRRMEGPGDLKIELDEADVENLLESAEKEKLSPKEVAGRIVKLADIADNRKLRIIRALADEDGGRLINSYQSTYYRPALEALLKDGYVADRDGVFHLTPKGQQLARQYLLQVLRKLNASIDAK